jgi:MFS family permease
MRSHALAPLTQRSFRLLFVAQAIWLLGSWMTPVALAFAVLDRTDSPTALGFVFAAETVPMAFLLLVGGVWADRLPRVRLMITADLVSFASQGVLAVLIISGRVEIWQMAVLAAVGGAADAFHTPAWSGLLPQTVPPAMLQRANALRHLESNTMRVCGPILAGVIVATAGAGWAIAADSASFVVAAAILAGVEVPSVAAAVEGAATTFRQELAGGWREVRSHGWLLAMMVDTAFWMLIVWGPYEVLGPLVAKRHLGGAGAWALISAGYGLGTVIGGLLGLRLHPRRPLLVAVLINAAFAPLLALLAVAAPTLVIAAVSIPAGAAVSLYLVLWDTVLQEQVPAGALARVASFERMSIYVPAPLGLALAGPVAAAIGVDGALWAATGWMSVSTLFLLGMPSVRGMQRVHPAASVAR